MLNNPYVYAFIAVFFWSTVATVFKLCLRNVHFLVMLFYSSLFSCLALFLCLCFLKNRAAVHRTLSKHWAKSTLLGLLNPFGYYLILFKAYSLLPAQQAQPLNYTWPIMLVLFSMIFLREKIGFRNFMGIVVSFVGVLVIATQGNLTALEIHEPFGVFLAVGSSLLWATYWLLNLQDRVDVIIRMFLNFLFGTLYIGLLVAFSGIPLSLHLQDFLFCGYIGLFEMGLTFVCWSKALQLSKGAKISHLVYLAPFISLLFIRFVLQEELLPSSIMGLCLIISGIFLGKK